MYLNTAVVFTRIYNLLKMIPKYCTNPITFTCLQNTIITYYKFLYVDFLNSFNLCF